MYNQLEDPHRELTMLGSNYIQLGRGSSHDCGQWPYTKNYRQGVQLGEGEVTISREEHSNWLLSAKSSALKNTHTTIYALNRLYL